MMVRREFRLRTLLVLLLAATILVTLAIVGSGILIVRIPQIAEDNQILVDRAARDMAERVEAFLRGGVSRLSLVGKFIPSGTPEETENVLEAALIDTFEAVYILNAGGKLIGSRIRGATTRRSRELVGIDLSFNSLFNEARSKGIPVWSDKHLSAVTGNVTIGLAVPINADGGVVIGEIALPTLLQISQIVQNNTSFELWIIDGNGEMVADTGALTPSRMNLLNLPIVAAGLDSGPAPERLFFEGHRYQAAASFSASLGWLFVSRIPAGLENPDVRKLVGTILFAFLGSCAIGLILAPFWAYGMARPLRAIMEGARQVARGGHPGRWPRGITVEFNQLSSDLERMAEAIEKRQEELQSLNEELETRVEHRTRDLATANAELSETLATLCRAQDELVQSEKLAALGRLVAGVAHELNTPLGNGRMAISTLRDKLEAFRRTMSEGLRRSDLEAFVRDVDIATEIGERNVVRAGDLVASFKQVAVDRTTSHRRRFLLDEVVKEIVLTLTPSIKRLPIEIRNEVPEDLEFESYPGELGQVLTNLIDNAIHHAFLDGRGGNIRLAVESADGEHVVLTVSDNGVGIPEKTRGRIFDPFFTTKMGSGGTGLGLYITHNAVGGVLGGTITVASEENVGTTFELNLPRVAPKAPEERA